MRTCFLCTRLRTCLHLLITCCLAFGTATLQAEIYQTVDKDGKVTFTDKPSQSDKATEVKLPPTNTTTPAPALPSTATNNQGDSAIRYEIFIVSPLAEAQIPPGQRDIAVSISLDRPLLAPHFLQLYLNGAPQGKPFKGNSAVLEEVYRGAHVLTASVTTKRGKIISSSAPINIYVQRTTVPRPAPKPVPTPTPPPTPAPAPSAGG